MAGPTAPLQSNMAKELIVSPKGELRWAKVFEPDEPVEAGKSRQWSIDLVLSGQEQSTFDFIARIEELMQTANGAGAKIDAKGWPLKNEVVDGAETGNVIFTFRRNETSQKGSAISPPVVVDSKRNPWPADLLIGNGSKGKVAFDFYGWDSKTVRGAKGLSLWLEFVQVIELVEYVRTAPSDVFAEEEGYEAPVAAAALPFEDESPAAPAPRRAPAPAPVRAGAPARAAAPAPARAAAPAAAPAWESQEPASTEEVPW